MKIKEIDRWRVEIELAEENRKLQFGEYTKDSITKAGENIEYYEKGMSIGRFSDDSEMDTYTTLNLFHAITKSIVPALYYQNPEINIIPSREQDEVAAPYVREIINHYVKGTDGEEVNKKVIWDAYVLGLGVCKVGYTTKFGQDIIDEKDEKKKRKDSFLVKLGLKEPKAIEVERPEINKDIESEMPYIEYVSPFEYLIDPRAKTQSEAMWEAHVVRKTVESLKSNPKYKNTSKINGAYGPDLPNVDRLKIPVTVIDAFKTVDLYEIHYWNEGKRYLLVISKDGDGDYKEHYHELSPYEIDSSQFLTLQLNNHGHQFYKLSDLSKIKNLQDRFTATLDSIFTQIDSFVPKVAIDKTKMSEDAINVLANGDIGAVVECSGNPNEIIRSVSFEQAKADLLRVIDEVINLITIQTGLTKAKLLGVSAGQTATGEQLSQGGETLRLLDMTRNVERFINKQSTIFWQVIRQFASFEQLELITGTAGTNENGESVFNWLDEIDTKMFTRLQTGNYSFQMAVGSTQRHDIGSIRKLFENLFNIVANGNVVQVAQMQGKKIDVGEFLEMYLRQFPEVIRNPKKIIQDITQNTQGLVPPEAQQDDGGGTNALRGLLANNQSPQNAYVAGGAQR